MLLEGDQFLSRLTLMFDKSRTKGHVQLTMKRYDGRTKPDPRPQKPDATSQSIKSKNKGQAPASKPAAEPKPRSESSSGPEEFMCLLRATYRDEKISTVVHPKDVNKFQLAYCHLLKTNMDGLKRQKKQKLKKATQ